MSRLDPRGPLVIDTRELGRRPGNQRLVTEVAPAPADLGNAVIAIPEGSPLDLELRLESVVEGVLVTGSVRGRALGECVRCLEAVDLALTVDLLELYSYPDSQECRPGHPEPEDDEHDVHLLVDERIDLEPVLRDSAVLALPLQPLCRVDCPGLCPTCGIRFADDPEHLHDSTDPRWSALSPLQSVSQEES